MRGHILKHPFVRRAEAGKNFSAVLILASLIATPVLAQVPSGSQIPPGETVERTGPAAQFSFPAAQGLRAPEGADAIKFTLGTLTIEGGLPALATQTTSLTPQKGAQVSVSDVYAFAGALQQAYLDAGFPLVRVIVPAQDLDKASGNISIRVVSGFVDSIDVSALPERAQKPVQKILMGLVGQSPVTAAMLEHRLLLAGETAGLSLRTALAPGSRTGATKLVLTGDHRLMQAALAIDNRMVKDLGGEQVTASFSLNSLLGQGDRLITTIAFAPDEPSLGEDALRRYGSVYFSMPVASNGLELGVELLGTSSIPQGDSALLALKSNFAKASVFAALPVQRRRDRAMTVKLSFDAAYEEQLTSILGFPIPLFTDRTRVIRANIEGYRPMPLGLVIGYSAQVSQGLDGLGARATDTASFLNPLSRLGADAAFTSANLSLNLQRSFENDTSILFTLRGTTGFGDPLLRSEQGSIVSSDLISGPPSGSGIGDETIGGRLEVRRTYSFDRLAIAPFVFTAAGQAKLQNPTVLETSLTKAQAAGIGAEIFFRTKSDQRWRTRLEWSQTQFDGPRPDDSNLTVSLVSRF
jgi:hemolysin activation/secretion protein